jgi:hypothetical protein
VKLGGLEHAELAHGTYSLLLELLDERVLPTYKTERQKEELEVRKGRNK